MNDKEIIIKSLAPLHASDDTLKEVYKKMAEKKQTRCAHPGRRLIAIAAVAAVMLALCATAYAANLFGVRGLLKPESVGKTMTAKWEHGTLVTGTKPNSGSLSMTQPQDGPAAYMDKVMKVKSAWSEWKAYCDQMSTVTDHRDFVVYDNEDGSMTVVFAAPDGEESERVTMSQEEFAQWFAAYEFESTQYGDYGFDYGVHSEEMAARLEEIAEEYGLSLCRSMTLLVSDDCGYTGEMFRSNEALTDLLADELGTGSVLAAVPETFDKLYYYDTGSFGFNAAIVLPDAGACYTYVRFTDWDDLISGNELNIAAEDVYAFNERVRTAPDGTEVAVLYGGSDLFLYAYLENGFFVGHVDAQELTQTDMDYLVDYFTYSNIGK